MTVTALEMDMPHEEFVGWLVHDRLEREEEEARKAAEKKKRPPLAVPDEDED